LGRGQSTTGSCYRATDEPSYPKRREPEKNKQGREPKIVGSMKKGAPGKPGAQGATPIKNTRIEVNRLGEAEGVPLG